VDVVAGALVEPLAVAVHAVVERAAVQSGERVLVVGPGTVGLLAAQVAGARGARVTIAGLARHAARFRLAEELGIGGSIRIDDEAGLAALCAATSTEDGGGFDVAFECSGGVERLADCLRLVRKGGRVTLVGFYGGPAPVLAQVVVDGELSLIGARGKRPSSFRQAVQLLGDGGVDAARLITHRFPLTSWEEALEVAARPGTKVVFDEIAG
jgi:2-desacetyl-2-hydroxyethyl bacteriochlorophyllide A dehydrogenase